MWLGQPGSAVPESMDPTTQGDRKSTRLNSSHSQISYAVFCLKKKRNVCYSCDKESSSQPVNIIRWPGYQYNHQPLAGGLLRGASHRRSPQWAPLHFAIAHDPL